MNDTVLCQLNVQPNIWNPKFIGPTLKCEGPMEGGLSVSQSVCPTYISKNASKDFSDFLHEFKRFIGVAK